MVVTAVLLALVPIYAVLLPPLPDLTQHILVNKLFWEKLAGVSNLDLEISWYLGYRLSAFVIVFLIGVCDLLGIPLVYLPKIVAMVLMSLHAVVVVPILYFGLRNREWKSAGLAFCFVVPAVVCMYSACWFMGFVGYTLAITLLVPAVFVTERFLRTGKPAEAFFLALLLFLVYTAHPFALVFWFLWCLSRSIVSIPMWTIRREWLRMILLGVIALPVFLYHYFSTAGSDLATSTQTLGSVSPFVTTEYWYKHRLLEFYKGDYLKADEVADASYFALLAIGLIIISAVLAFRPSQTREIKTTVLSSVFFLVICSWINEKFIPVPTGHWLAYDLRFSSTVYAICIAVAAMALIRFLPIATNGFVYKIFFIGLAFVSMLISAGHLIEVQKAHARFDIPARAFIEKVFDHQRPVGILLPRSRWWYPDSKFLRHYSCLEQPDCNPAGTLFTNVGGIIYPVKVNSPKRIFPPKPYAPNRTGKPGNAIDGGEGYAGGQFSRPRGIAVDDAGHLYVADTGNSRIQKFDADGNFIWDFGTYGDGEGEFKAPHGVAVDAAGNIYVSDATSQKLLRFKPDGTFEKEWKTATAGISVPLDIAFGPNKQLYIAGQNHRVAAFNPATEEFSAWGTAGSGEGGFFNITGIATGDNLVFVADSGNNRIQVLDLAGKFVRQWEVSAWAKYVWHYPDAAYDEQTGRLYVTNGWSREVLVLNSNGEPIGKLAPGEKTEFNSPSSIVLSNVNGRKRLYVLSSGSDKVDNGDPGVSLFDLENLTVRVN